MGQAQENVANLYLDGIANGNAREAVYKYTGHRYTQHSTGVGDGAEGFLTFFEPFLDRNPKRDIKLVRLFQDGRWVFCNAYQSLNDGAAEWVTMDMFFTDADGLILEHWDTIAAHEGGMVDGIADIDTSVDTDASKDLVLEFTKQVLQQGDRDAIDQFVAADLIQHEPGIAQGRAGLAEWLAGAGWYEMLFHIMGQGDTVVTYGKRHANGADIAVFDVYRVSGGKIAEHWACAEQIGPRETWGNSGKF